MENIVETQVFHDDEEGHKERKDPMKTVTGSQAAAMNMAKEKDG